MRRFKVLGIYQRHDGTEELSGDFSKSVEGSEGELSAVAQAGLMAAFTLDDSTGVSIVEKDREQFEFSIEAAAAGLPGVCPLCGILQIWEEGAT